MDKKEQIALNNFIERSKNNYLKFMSLDNMPDYSVTSFIIPTNGTAKKRGYGSFAGHLYNVETWKHELHLWKEIYKPQLNAEYILFHEFTHLCDSEMYVKKDKLNNAGIMGYTEYHAAQIDFLRLLKIEKVHDVFSFSLDQEFKTVSGLKKARDFLLEPHNAAIQLINREDFPADIKTLSTTLGLIFNYWGRRSICKMYATDYDENIDSSKIELFIGKERFEYWNKLMNGWFDTDVSKIELACRLYLKMLISFNSAYEI